MRSTITWQKKKLTKKDPKGAKTIALTTILSKLEKKILS